MIHTNYSLTNNEQTFINHAFNEALKSPVLMRHGAVAVANGKIMGRGHNHYRTYSKDSFISNTCTCHADTRVYTHTYAHTLELIPIRTCVCAHSETSHGLSPWRRRRAGPCLGRQAGSLSGRRSATRRERGGGGGRGSRGERATRDPRRRRHDAYACAYGLCVCVVRVRAYIRGRRTYPGRVCENICLQRRRDAETVTSSTVGRMK